MTTFIDFVPPTNTPFEFSPTLDGAQYNATVTWNLFGRRWYVNVYDLGGLLIFSVPMIGSQTGITIANGSWANGRVTITTTMPHEYTVGQIVEFTVAECLPDAYNGKQKCEIASANSYIYDLAANPGTFTALGTTHYNINIAGGYFASTLVYRVSSNQIEVSP